MMIFYNIKSLLLFLYCVPYSLVSYERLATVNFYSGYNDLYTEAENIPEWVESVKV